MARMWPHKLPSEVRTNELRSAEVRVYDALRTELDDDYVVFYSRPWLGLTPEGREIDGECDFVVAHVHWGFLAIEVKGGGIQYRPDSDQWISVDRHKCRHKIKNPVGQASSSKHQIVKKLQRDPTWPGHFIRIRHGVIFPDCVPASSDLGAGMPREIFCFSDRFESGLGEWIRERMANKKLVETETPLGKKGMQILERLLAKPFQLRAAMAPALRESVRVQDLLTVQQYHVLSALEAIPRAGIAGAAGTGKTVLAVEKARRCAEAGKTTLFVCYNKPLSATVSELLLDLNVRSVTFHGLCAWMAKQAGLSVPRNASSGDLHDHVYPSLLMDGAALRPDICFDAIVIDEGQDFLSHWWAAIDALLADEREGNLYVFFDSNQRVYGGSPTLPADAAVLPIRLTRNLRNTRAIHDAATYFYDGFTVEAVGPDGEQPEWRAVKGSSVRTIVAEKVTQLIRHEKVTPDSIAVLVPNRRVLDELVIDGHLGGYVVRDAETNTPQAVTVETIRRYKGLESPVVLLVATEPLVDELAYVALSRARSHLIVIGPEEILNTLKAGEGAPA